MSPLRRALVASLVLGALAFTAVPAAAQTASWRSEPVTPAGSSWPVNLGKVGDIEFWAPNRGLLITEGETPTVEPGIWAYNGVEWHELSSVCGATDGRIAWASPGEFWTVSNERSGEAYEVGSGGQSNAAPVADDTLCRFSGGHLVGSYAHPPDEPNSYLAMDAAGCLSPSDCWFGGEALEAPQIGSFQLHWNGSSLENEPYLGEGYAVGDLQALEDRLYESVRITAAGRLAEPKEQIPALRRINPEGFTPAIEPEEGRFEEGLPLYAPDEPEDALGSLHLSSAEGALWAAAGKSSETVTEGHVTGQVTLLRGSEGRWEQLIGPERPLAAILPADESEEEELLGGEATRKGQSGGEAKDAVVSALAAEPGSDSVWMALSSPEVGTTSAQVRAVLLHISAAGQVLEEATLPSASEQEEGIGAKGAAATLACPKTNDCWLSTTQGWLFHLAPEDERRLPKDEHESEYFTGPITYRPADAGLPQVPPDEPPPDDSGLVEEPPSYGYEQFKEAKEESAAQSKVTLPLLSQVHSQLLRSNTLELSFHLAVKARVRLIGKRKGKEVASTPTRTFGAGKRKLLLKLNPRRWPTKLSLQTHALAPLPVVSSVTGAGANVTTVTTGLFVLPRSALQSGSGKLP